MSGALNPLSPTVAAYPSTSDTAMAMLALLGAQSGVLTDYNPGSIIRTFSEAVGSVVELQGISEQTLAFQTMVYGALSALNIVPRSATFATGVVTFNAPGPVAQTFTILAGTLLQTPGGVQFQTLTDTLFASGSSSVLANIQSILPGSSANVASGTVTQILSSLVYPLTVINNAPVAGGANAESLATTLSRFAAAVGAPGLTSPYAIANAAYGLSYGTESVVAASVYEPWIAAGSGSGSGQASFVLYIDNGTGGASQSLISAVASAISSGTPSLPSGFRPAGVPFTVASVSPVYAAVSVTGVLAPGFGSATGVIASNTSGAVASYIEGLLIGQTLYQGNLAGVVGDAGQGQLVSFTVSLSGSPGSGIASLAAPYSGRVILSQIQVNFSSS